MCWIDSNHFLGMARFSSSISSLCVILSTLDMIKSTTIASFSMLIRPAFSTCNSVMFSKERQKHSSCDGYFLEDSSCTRMQRSNTKDVLLQHAVWFWGKLFYHTSPIDVDSFRRSCSSILCYRTRKVQVIRFWCWWTCQLHLAHSLCDVPQLPWASLLPPQDLGNRHQSFCSQDICSI